MPGSDPGHWLHRLDAAEWLAAAATELAHAEEKLSHRAVRPGVTHARRAAGMAWNAVLVTAPDERYGRSYMDHVVALAQTPDGDPSIPAAVRDAARLLREIPAAPPQLITIGKPDLSALEAARAILEFAREVVSRPR
jgi:HEPN domain-containing protein